MWLSDHFENDILMAKCDTQIHSFYEEFAQ